MSSNIRVRFAPSPTGPLHIGGVRTALFNFLFAKKNGGDFVLRIEDTDQNRYVKGAEQYIIDALQWCGILFDEGPGMGSRNFGPYRQSERKAIYKEYADKLIASGDAYYAFDTADQLNFHRKDHEEKGKTFIYNWHNRLKLSNSLSLSQAETLAKISSGENYVIRFKTPQDKILELYDEIRGTITIDTNVLDDKVLFKSDGMPTYHLANIVDDHLMKISHVIRGEEWLPSLALHQLLYDALEWQAPKFAHLPLIMKPTGKGKLSKRDGDKFGFPVFPIAWEGTLGYKENGYFPEAVINFLAMLGWNPGNEEELFDLETLIDVFDLNRVAKSGARFDPEKTKWYNQQYLQAKSNKQLAELFIPILEDNLSKMQRRPNIDSDKLEQIVGLIKERAAFVQEFWDLSAYFFISPESYDEKAVRKQWKEGTPKILKNLNRVLETITDFSAPQIESMVKEWIASEGLSFGSVMPPLRLVMVGEMKGPHIFNIMDLLGKEECMHRIENALQRL